MAFKGFEKRRTEREKNFLDHISTEVLERYCTGKPIGIAEWNNMRTNSYERQLLLPLLTTEAIIQQTQYALEQEGISKAGKFEIPHSYKDSILKFFIWELIDRVSK